jgi:hypothetical protein
MLIEAKYVPEQKGRTGLKETTKRIKIFANLNKTPEHILSRFGEFALLATKFSSIRWSGEVFFTLSGSVAQCSTNDLKVVQTDSEAFLSHTEVINAIFRSIAASGKNDFELTLRISAKRR